SRRSDSSTGDPSGTLSTSMPSSAGAGTEWSISRWDPGRRPSSRVSSTSGALGSRLVTGPFRHGTTEQREFRRSRPPARNRVAAATGSALALEVLGQADGVDVVAAELVEHRATGQPAASATHRLEGALEGDLEVGQRRVDVVVGLLAQLTGLGLGID